MRGWLMAGLLLVLSVTTVQADVMLEAIDAHKGLLQITYTFTDSDAGSTGFIFPPVGFDFDHGSLQVLEVVDVGTGKPIHNEVIPAPHDPTRQALKVSYEKPLPIGSYRDMRIVIRAKTAALREEDGACVLRYKTAHSLTYRPPAGHAFIGINKPGKVVVQNGRLELVIDRDPLHHRDAESYEIRSRKMR